MIYLFYGDDSARKYPSFEKFIKSIPKDTEVIPINRNNFNQTQIESLYSGSNLFSTNSAVVFSNIFEYEENGNFILGKLNFIAESKNTFIFLEDKLNKPIIDAFKKNKTEINFFDLPKEKKEKFDNFLIANAFAGGDKLNTWIYFRQAMDLDVSLEEIVGVLFWKIKDMILRKNYGKFTVEQLKDFVIQLSFILPEARKSGRDAESALEQFLLKVF